MKKPIPASELILNPDGSIYHLHLRPDQIARTVLFVGDPDRVPKVSRHFDRIEHKVQKREFITHTGYLNGKRLSVLSTGIGTDNIDVVMNELDALFNVDFETRMVKETLTSLDIVRIGTSGIISNELDVDEYLVSAYAIGLEALLPYYKWIPNQQESDLTAAFTQFAQAEAFPVLPIAVEGANSLMEKIGQGMHRGITLTCSGFYAPQGREIRLQSRIRPDFFEKAGQFKFGAYTITNFEMETAGIYGMARLLGHRAVSCNALLAHRIKNQYSSRQQQTVDRLIETVLQRLTS